MNNFPVGTIVILQNCGKHEHMNGQEATITKPLELRYLNIPDEELLCYGIDIKLDGYINLYPQPHQVRLKQEPPKESSSDEEAFRRFMDKTLMPLTVE